MKDPFEVFRRPFEEAEQKTLVKVLLAAVNETGVTWKHIEKALGAEYAANHKGWILGILHNAKVKVNVPVPSLADSPLPQSVFPSAVLERLAAKGIKTWRDLFMSQESELLAAPFTPADALAIRKAIDRTGYRFGMTSEEVDARAAALSKEFEIALLDLGLTTRPTNVLHNCEATTLAEICSLTESDLRSFRNFGQHSIDEVKAMLEKHGLSLGMIVPAVTPRFTVTLRRLREGRGRSCF